MALDPSPEELAFLSTMPAGPGHRRLALAVVLVAATLFLIGLPFASVQLLTVWAFIPIYESWLVIIDAITAVLLFGQFSILRSRALLVLGSGYLFTATITVAHALSFPGLFTPTGLLGAGTQTTAWLYAFLESGICTIHSRLRAAQGREAAAICAASARTRQYPRKRRVRIDSDRFAHVARDRGRKFSTHSHKWQPLRAWIILYRAVWLDDRPDRARHPLAAATIGARPLGSGRWLCSSS
jgi:Membrane-associated sensor, integral membrane domain